jgi:hypothetical protein
MANIFKDKMTAEEARSCMGNGAGTAVMTAMDSKDSRDARLPGERKNYEAGVVSAERPRRGYGY